MSSLDIFNASTGLDEGLGFNPNWSYQSPRKGGETVAISKPQYGMWSSREISDAGYAFQLLFVDVPMPQVLYIRRFYEQFKRGWFTLIDHDNGGREHVGRFTSRPQETPSANMKYNVQVNFEEVPGAPMRNYPSDWENSSHWIYSTDDAGKVQPYVSGAGWASRQTAVALAAGLSVADPSSYELYTEFPAVNDFAQCEYIGWGFQCSFSLNSSLGRCEVLFDGSTILDGLDLSTGAYNLPSGVVMTTGVTTGATPVLNVSMPNVPLGRHRLKVIASATKNPAATGIGVVYPALQVIY